ncbi:Lysine-specific demethylase 4 [Frankliniella fusca]|uniref:Lysine-specific demethylase 4 n=1 Tax=Frankliniella fusca TaxID=407009 RepID=A0AAE1LCM4_9NEOP|nr:Lysine-specific demethylase 4 [Frankliniella fusca]
MSNLFTITEEELADFESFCDMKYLDPECQKYGYFKVKLDDSCAGKYSSMADFNKMFRVDCLKNIMALEIRRCPTSPNLYGHQAKNARQELRLKFMEKFDVLLSERLDCTSTCWQVQGLQLHVTKELQKSEDKFLQHFFREMTCNASTMALPIHNPATVRSKIIKKRVSLARRQSYASLPSLQAKRQCLELHMITERINGSSSVNHTCDTCSSDFILPSQNKCGESDTILYSPGIEESPSQFLYLTENFAMVHLCTKNMLSDLDGVYAGVSFPSVYASAGYHSVFPLHVEDMSLWSFNFLLHGFPKFWILIPPTSIVSLTHAIHRRGFGNAHKWCHNTLSHKFFIPSPEFLRDENIPHKVVIQQQGEGIVLFPNTAHAGGNLGPNLSEACNFGTKKWIPYGCVAPNCTCIQNAVHIDMTDIVALHEPSLLTQYLTNDIRDVVKDEYYKKSILVPGKDHSSGQVVATTSKIRVKCPACNVSWSYAQKRNMTTHLRKYHIHRMEEDVLKQFVQEHFLHIT